MNNLQEEIRAALNRATADSLSGTPDYVLGEFLTGCLAAYIRASKARAAWHHNDQILKGPHPTELRGE